MKLDYYFANLDLSVVLSSEKCFLLDSLTDNESLALQQQIYLAVSSFLNCRALYTLDAATPKEKLESEKDTVDFKPDGG